MTKLPDVREEGLLWGREISLHGSLTSCVWTEHHGDRSMWWRLFFTFLQEGSRKLETGRGNYNLHFG